jgi:DNA replication and repair protein RecF
MLTAVQEACGSAGTGFRRVAVTRLVLTDFRNYSEARIALGAEPVVLTGPNGAGKTNLLEALSLLAPGRGLRRARLGDLDRRADDAFAADTRAWAVAATVEAGGGPIRIGTGRAPEAGERRVVHIDGEPARAQAALGERFAVAWLTPAMDRLFGEGPSARRRFLDRLVLALDPAHATRVAAYEQALRERAQLLREGAADRAWLEALEQVMAEQGIAIAAARRETVRLLADACAEAEGPFPRPGLALVGAPAEWLDTMPALAAEAAFAAALADSRKADAAAGGAAIGPHRDELAVTLAEKGIAATLASTGEQKALLIAVLLAHARILRQFRGESPILLLDEIAAHLDAGRRAALFEALRRLESQAWLTGTDAAVFAPLRRDARFLSVHDGTVGPTPL